MIQVSKRKWPNVIHTCVWGAHMHERVRDRQDTGTADSLSRRWAKVLGLQMFISGWWQEQMLSKQMFVLTCMWVKKENNPHTTEAHLGVTTSEPSTPPPHFSCWTKALKIALMWLCLQLHKSALNQGFITCLVLGLFLYNFLCINILSTRDCSC